MSLAGELLRQFETEITSLGVVPSDGGRFEVSVNWEVVFSKKQLGRHADPGEVVGLVRKLVEK